MTKVSLITIITLLFISCTTKTNKGSEVNIYTHRHYDIDQKIYDDFEKEFGIEVNVLKADADELINKIALEGENTHADLLITVDASRLNRARSKG